MLRPLKFNSLKYFKANIGSSAVYSSPACEKKKVAVILSGCGVLDGSEIHEAASVLIHLTRGGINPVFFAPDCPQYDVIDHIKGCPDEGPAKRNVLTESARIARGKICSLGSLTAEFAEAVIFPGGFGVAKNLSDFAEKGADCTVDKEVERILNEFKCAKKPIGLICIAPILAAKVFGNVTITLGKKDDGTGKWPHADARDAAMAMGAKLEDKDVNNFTYDEKNNILSTPAFMYDGEFHHVYGGIGAMIKKLLTLIN